MRRLVVLTASVALLASCDPREMFTAHADTVAEAGNAELPAQKVANLMLTGKNISLNRETADFIANMWIDYSLFAQALAKGQALNDSATIAAAMWPQVAELTATHWFDTLVAQRSNISASAIDAAYNGTAMRVFQHILFSFGPNPTADQKATARRGAEAAQAQLKRGADFGTLAGKLSMDPGSSRDSGFLPPSPRGRWVVAFDSAGWILGPGETSGIVESSYGLHIIKRPALADVRGRVETWLQTEQTQSVTTAYLDSLALANDLKMKGDAATTIRKAVEDPDRYDTSPKAIADFKNGKLDTRELLRWVRNFPPQMIAQIKSQPDSSLNQFGKMLATNVLLLRQADSAGVKLTAIEWATIQEQYKAQIDSLKNEMEIAGDVADASAPEADRLKLAESKVDAYFASLVGQRKRLRPLPQALGMVLRDRSDFDIREAGLNQALDIARQQQAAAADSARAAGGTGAPATGAPAPQMPAPGNAPAPTTPAPSGQGGN